MATELIRPIDAETAKALQEAAKALGKVTDILSSTGGYAADVAGDLPHNLIGILGDKVFHSRRMRALELDEAYRARLRARNVEPAELSPSVVIPLLEGAVDETRDELKGEWVRLLANAADPKRRDRVRLAFIGMLKQFDPLDALVLRALATKRPTPTTADPRADFKRLIEILGVSGDEFEVSFDNLKRLGLARRDSGIGPMHRLNSLGREFLRAVED